MLKSSMPILCFLIPLCLVPTGAVSADSILAAAQAHEFEVGEIIQIDNGTAWLGSLSLSNDATRFAYYKEEGEIRERKPTLVVGNMTSGRLLDRLAVPHSVRASAWAPDDNRIALCANESITIVDLNTKKATTLPGKVGLCSRGFTWHRDDEIVYERYGDKPVRLSLVDLTTSSMELHDFRELHDPKSFSTHPKVFATRCVGICINSKNLPYSHLLKSLGQDDGSELIVTPDQSTFVAVSFEPFASDDETSKVWWGRMKTRVPPPIVFKAGFNAATPSFPLEEVMPWLERGSVIGASVWDPRINPLNGLTVGAEGSYPKASVTVVGLKGDGLIVRVTQELRISDPVKPGDVVSNLESGFDSRGNFYAAPQGAWLVLLSPIEDHEYEHLEGNDQERRADDSASSGFDGGSKKPKYLILRTVDAVAIYQATSDPVRLFRAAVEAVKNAGYTISELDFGTRRVAGFNDLATTSFLWRMEVRVRNDGGIELWIERGASGERVPDDVPALVKYISRQAEVGKLRDIVLSYENQERPLSKW